jgi:hypothetical protein
MRRLILAGLAATALVSGGAASAQTVTVQERWGHWDPTWGHQPGPPPHAMWRHWRGHEANYYGHVHNCMVRYHTYDAHRDMYRVGHRWVACRD